MAASIEMLEEALETRFSCGARRLVPVVGCGLHSHLAAHGVAPLGGGKPTLNAWNELLRQARFDGSRAEFPEVLHVDPTATWEGMLVARALAVPTKRAYQHEKTLRARVARLVEGATPTRDSLKLLGSAFASRGFRDIVTLNFDRTLDTACQNASEKESHLCYDVVGRGEELRRSLRFRLANARIWHPHGIAAKGVSQKTLQLGLISYSKSLNVVRAGIRGAREKQRDWLLNRRGSGYSAEVLLDSDLARSWEDEVRSWESDCWVDQLLFSDFAFIGCGLDRAELDIWLLLHERQRQALRLRPDARPRTFYVHPRDRFPEHLKTGPAGITPVYTDSYDQGWELLVGKWWS